MKTVFPTQLVFCWAGFAPVERHLNTSRWRWVSKFFSRVYIKHKIAKIFNSLLFTILPLFLLTGVSVYQLTTGCMYSSLFLCKPCGESYWIIGTVVDIFYCSLVSVFSHFI